jgi:hypothetical protein
MNHMQQVVRVTEAEIFVAKVKLAGLTILGLICAVVVAVSPP